jgi:hypothetical protein
MAAVGAAAVEPWVTSGCGATIGVPRWQAPASRDSASSRVYTTRDFSCIVFLHLLDLIPFASTSTRTLRGIPSACLPTITRSENACGTRPIYDEANTVIKTESGYINIILPGEQLGLVTTTYLEEGLKAARLKFKLIQGRTETIDISPPLFGTGSATFFTDDYFPVITGIIKNNIARDITDLRVNALAYDDADNLIGGGYTYLNFVPSSGETGIAVNVIVPSSPAKIELYPTVSGLSALKQSEEMGPVISRLSQDFVQSGREVTVIFFTENSDEKQAIEDSIYQVAVFDEEGIVLGHDSGYINIVLPGEKLAHSATLYIPEGTISSTVEVQLLSGDPHDTSISGTPFLTESLQFIPDQYYPKITGIVKNGINRDISDLRITAVAYDEAENVIGGGFTYLDFLPASGQAAVEVSTKVSANPAKVEIYPTLSSLSDLEVSSAEKNLQLVRSGIASGTFGTEIVFLVKKHF